MAERDPLPSWNAGPTRAAILDFAARVTDEAHADFLPPAERVAVFGHDGTLWCEYPVPMQVLFTRERLAQIASRHAALRQREPFKAFLDSELPQVDAMGLRALLQLGFVTYAGLTLEDFTRRAAAWVATARHPSLHRAVAACAYQPQLELMAFLRARGFAVFIVTCGSVDFVRAFAPAAYGVAPSQVIGSSVKTQVDLQGGQASVVTLSEMQSWNDRETKVRNLGLHVGVRPVFAFGNADGDLAMLRYTLAGAGPRLALLLHHDDEQREFAYDGDFFFSPLDEALQHAGALGIRVVSMRRDWATVFPEAPS